MKFCNFIDEYPALNDFKKSIQVLSNFVIDEQWLNMLKVDIALNPVLEREMITLINDINICNVDFLYYNDLIKKLRERFNNYQIQAGLETDVVKKWYKYRHAYAYYGIIEVITEGSIITEKILSGLKKKYKNKYLDVLKTIDNIHPSNLTNINIETNVRSIKEDELVKLYLTMKYWQDDQHVFHDEVVYPEFKKAMDGFEQKVYEQNPHLQKISGYALLPLYLLDEAPMVDINIISRFILSNLNKELTLIFGGKSVGLSILNSIECRIPQTYAISVGSLERKKYIGAIKKLPSKYYAVRSSATAEDNENQSFAGLFVSVLNVQKSKLREKIRVVQNSIFSSRVETYIKHFHIERPYMSVIIQEYKEPEFAGVWIGNEIKDGNLEWVVGNGEKLVSGHVKPTFEKWPNNNGITINNQIIGKECLLLQERLNSPADLEWCIVDGILVWLQYRPVTHKIYAKKIDMRKHHIVGIPSSSGKVIGKPIFLKSASEINDFQDGAILLTDYTDPDWVPIMMNSSGIITAEGGFLSHTAIISRELGLPCITGIGYENIGELKKHTLIEMDGSTGGIRIINDHKESN